MNDIELLNKLYCKDLIMSGLNELYKKAKEVHPKITIKIVKEWLSNQQSSQMNNNQLKRMNLNQFMQNNLIHFKLI